MKALFLKIFIPTLYIPLYNLFVVLIGLMPSHNVALAIIVLTALVRLALTPLRHKSIETQVKQQELQPELKALQEKHGKDRQALATAQMQLYRDRGINPASGCLPALIQLPILIVLYFVFRAGLGPEQQGLLYRFVAAPTSIDTSFLWVRDITQHDPTLILPIVAAVAQFLFMRTNITRALPTGSGEDMAAIMSKQMVYLAPAMTVLIARSLPAGLSLYWAVATLLDWGLQVAGTKRVKARFATSRVAIAVRRKGQD